MPDVTIHRCTLRIVRHGGWSWGAAPNTLLQSAIKVLPELIARELGQYWTEEDDHEIAAPVHISIPIHLNELLAIGSAASHARDFNYDSEFSVVGQRINSAVRAALVDKCALPEGDAESVTTTRVREEVEQLRSRLESFVVEVLRAWQQQGVLAQRLAVFSAVALEAWHEYLVKQSNAAIEFASEKIDAIASSIVESLRLMPLAAPTREGILRRRLIVIAEVLARFDLARCPAMVLSKLDEVIPLEFIAASDDLARPIEASSRDADQSEQSQKNSRGGLSESRSRNSVMGVEAESLRDVGGRVMESSGLPSNALALPASIPEPKTGPRRGDLALVPNESTASEVMESSGLPSASSPLPASVRELKTASRSADLGLVPNKSTSSEIQASASPPPEPVLSQPPPANLQVVPTHQPLQHIANKLRRDASALPFLLLGPLARTGYLQTLAAVLEASETTAASPLFATALAYKLLAPPERGWRRSAATLSSAAAFAALESPAPEPALVQFAQTIAPHLSPLDVTLSGALIAGHNPNVPLLLLSLREKGTDGFLLFDTEGIFPIQWAASVTDLRSTLIQLDSSIVFVPRASADGELLRWLNSEGLRFVTDAPPTRGESLRSIRRPPDIRLWTNDEATADSVFARLASSLTGSVEDAFELLQVLAKNRPSISLNRDSALDRHLTMAAAVALGTIAWDLWKEHEQTAPHVALERFADLHARVDYTDDLVTVSLPLGKRFLDLRDHGLLEDVNDVPWLNGRKLIFTSG